MYQDDHNSKIFGALIIALSIIFSSCNASAIKSSNSQPAESQKNVEPERSPEITDPTCCGFSNSDAHKNIDEAWRLFTKDGRYRLALEQDMKFSESAKNDIAYREGRSGWNPLNRVFAYSWGHLGYDTEQDHLAAIVVDNTRTDDSRFGLVIFSKPKGGKYKSYWLYQKRDLSRTLVYQVSGSLGILEYQDDGKNKGCWVEWNPRLKQYICR